MANAYSIRNSRDTLIATITEGARDTTATSVVLHGRGATEYGLQRDQNLVYMLENFSNATPPANPIDGQLWWKTGDELKIWIGSPEHWQPAVFSAAAGDGILVTTGSPTSSLISVDTTVVRTAISNTFTKTLLTNDPAIQLSSVQPTIIFNQTDGSTDSKIWAWRLSTESLRLNLFDDTYAGASTWLQATRGVGTDGGTTISSSSFGGRQITIGSSITDTIKLFAGGSSGATQPARLEFIAEGNAGFGSPVLGLMYEGSPAGTGTGGVLHIRSAGYVPGLERVITTSDLGLFAMKSADETLNTDNTLNNDADLVLTPLKPNTHYLIEGIITFNTANGTMGWQWALTPSQTAQSMFAGVSYACDSATLGIDSGHTEVLTSGPNDTQIPSGTNIKIGLLFKGYIQTHATLSSSITFRWSQSVSDASNLTLLQGSWLRAIILP